MKQINDLAKSATQNIGKTSETSLKLRPEQRSRDLAKALFQKMRAIFPQKWDAQFSNEQVALLNMDEWAIGIRDLTDEQLAKGVDNVRRNCEWPPSIAEFREACLGKEELNEFGLNYIPEYYRQPIREKTRLLSGPEREASRSKGREVMDKLKKKLGINQ